MFLGRLWRVGVAAGCWAVRFIIGSSLIHRRSRAFILPNVRLFHPSPIAQSQKLETTSFVFSAGQFAAGVPSFNADHSFGSWRYSSRNSFSSSIGVPAFGRSFHPILGRGAARNWGDGLWSDSVFKGEQFSLLACARPLSFLLLYLSCISGERGSLPP